MSTPDVLVTGSAGHLGHALMLQLPSYGFTPVGLDIKKSDRTSLIGSISDRALVKSIFSNHPAIRYVLHTATLHKPHVGSHSKDDFIRTNIQGTLVLLEEASKIKLMKGFIFTSTTSTFGAALSPARGQPAAWIDENVVPIPKNIYGTSKVAAEDLCQLIYNEKKMPVLVLKVSRFFPEADDNDDVRDTYDDDNLKVCEFLYRRVDIADVVSAHVCAMRQAMAIGWSKYIISAPPPFQRSAASLQALGDRADDEIKRICPEQAKLLQKYGWKLPTRLDRVYDSSKAVRELKWAPVYTFQRVVERVNQGIDWRSSLTVKVGKRGYHDVVTGIYTT